MTAMLLDDGACPFVSRGCAFDEDLMGDAQNAVFRSTPVAPITFTSSSECMSISDSEFCSGYGSSRENPSPSQLVRKVNFSSIAEEFPLSTTGRSNLLQFQPSDMSLAPIYQHATAATSIGSAGFVPFVSTAERATPPLGTILEVTQPDEQTILNRSATIRKESGDENRHSPFGPIVLQETQPYQYNATKSEMDEMEVRLTTFMSKKTRVNVASAPQQMKWNLQEQVFQRYFDLKQKEPHWGSLEVRESRIFFHPGKRREAIMTEKKFHDQTYREMFEYFDEGSALKVLYQLLNALTYLHDEQ
ncbi:hypothetical protein ATCC90586_008948 [Pythium insidiosum]|nr:hypothetical protein ATCC90586_008948 [Pythium insidiosum]